MAVPLGLPATALKVILSSFPLSDEDQTKAVQGLVQDIGHALQRSFIPALQAALIKQCSPAELEALQLSAPARPLVPRGLEQLPVRQRLQAVQKVIVSLQYNHAPGYHYSVSKSRPFSRIMDTARDTLREALPIKCLEAVFLGVLLTAGWQDLDRVPVGFKSVAQGQVYRHIILAVRHAPSGTWGALGISRRSNLMDKDLVFDSLPALMADYIAAYKTWWHRLDKIRVGLPMEHDTYWPGSVCWRHCHVSPCKQEWAACAATLDAFAGDMRRFAAKYRVLGTAPAVAKSGLPKPSPDATRCARSVSPSRRRTPTAAPLALAKTTTAPVTSLMQAGLRRRQRRSSDPGDEQRGAGMHTTGSKPAAGGPADGGSSSSVDGSDDEDS